MKFIPVIVILVALIGLTSCSVIDTYTADQNVSEPIDLELEDPFANQTTNTTPEEEFEDDASVNDTEDTSQESESSEQEETTGETESEVEEEFVSVTVKEGETVDLSGFEAKDPDGDIISYTYSNPVSEEGTWTPVEGDEGTYIVDITASDGVLETTQQVKIEVTPMNKPPVIECPEEFKVSEGEIMDIPCEFYDKEGDDISYEVEGFMDTLKAETDYDDAGTYDLTITATDDKRESSTTMELVITDTNRAPVVNPIQDITVNEGETVSLTVDAMDPDGDALSIKYPPQFDESGTWTTTSEDIGTYELEVTVTDGESTVRETVKVKVEDINQPPVLEPMEDIVVDEGETITLPIEASDEDSEDLDITVEGFMTSTEYTTTYEDAGEYTVTVTVSDEESEVSEDVSITVNDVNRPPVFIS
ncbi:MAG: PKD domain-containing protein [Nanobdellota archaeon]